jgi:hypothetical protein
LIPGRGTDASLRRYVSTGSGVQPASCKKGTRAIFSVIKRLGREANHSLLSRVEDPNMQRYIPPKLNKGKLYNIAFRVFRATAMLFRFSEET